MKQQWLAQVMQLQQLINVQHYYNIQDSPHFCSTITCKSKMLFLDQTSITFD